MRAVANLGGVGSLIASASTTNPVQQGSAIYSGVGQMVANLTSPILQSSVTFAGAGQMTANLTRPEDSATTAWAAAVVAAGGTVSDARRSLVNDLILGLKSDGIWTKLDRLWILAAENSQSALIDLVANETASIVSTPVPTFTTDRGYTGAGGGYIDTGFVPSDGGAQLFDLDDAHYSCWSLTSSLPSGTYSVCGNGNDTWLKYDPDYSFYFRINEVGGATAPYGDFTTHAGHFISSRSSSTQRKLYQDGTLKYTTNATSASLTGSSQFIISNGTSGVGVAAYSLGSNLNGGSDASNFYDRLATYMTAVGVL